MLSAAICLLACLLLGAANAQIEPGPLGLRQAVVKINAKGITGTITFTEVDETNVTVVADLQGLQGSQVWHVHDLPVDQTVDPNLQCLSSWVGPHYDPTNARANLNYSVDCSVDTPENCEYGDLAGRFGPLPISGQLKATDSTGQLTLRGFNSIVGRAVVIHEHGTGRNFECGTIRPQEELDGANVTILQAIFVSPVAGRMYFKQVYGLPDVQIWGKLYYVNDSPATMNHNWHVHQTLPVEKYRIGSCAEAGPHYDPLGADATSDGYGDRCSPQTPKGCEIGDLTGKLGTIDVAAQPAVYSSGAFFFTDVFLNLTGTYPIIDRSVVVHNPERTAPRLSCAPLVDAEHIRLSAVRSFGGDTLANISQYSRYQDTVVSLGLLPTNKSDNPDLSIVSAVINSNTPCPLDGDSTPFYDSTYTPYPPVANVTTPDGFPLGDLSNSYDEDIRNCSDFTALDLPLFGARVTLFGHTLRYTHGNSRECGVLSPPLTGDNVFAARASFSGRDIGGTIYFIQNRDGDVVTGSTFIIVDIYYNVDRNTTDTHNWHIHQNPAVDGQMCDGTIGGHYNPFNVSLATSDGTNSDYSTDCNGNYQLRCESGDMSGKHGQLSIASASNNDRPTYSYIDNNLELGGIYSIIERSVGLHLPSSEGGALFDCATVERIFIADEFIASYVPVDLFRNRVEFAEAVSNGVTDPNNILILNQYINKSCVKTSMRVVGEDPDNDARLLNDKVNEEYRLCSAFEEGDLNPRCSTAVCVFNGVTYSEGDIFPAGDGCNECFCSDGVVGCSLRFCPEPCDDDEFSCPDDRFAECLPTTYLCDMTNHCENGYDEQNCTVVLTSPMQLSIVEGEAGTLQFCLTVGLLNNTRTLRLTSFQGSAQRNLDYTFSDVNVTFMGSESGCVTVNVSAPEDNLVEGTEMFYAAITPGPNVSIFIIDNDYLRVGFEETSYSVAESGGVLEIPVRVLADENGNIPDVGLPLGLRVTTRDGSAIAGGGDYQRTLSTLYFRPDRSLDLVTRVSILDDDLDEGQQRFSVELTAFDLAIVLVDRSTEVVILDDDEDTVVEVCTAELVEPITVDGSSATAIFRGVGTNSLVCKLDGDRLPTCSSPVRLTGLAGGLHRLRLGPIGCKESRGRTFRFTV